MDVKNLGVWVVSQQFVADSVHQVGFTQADTAIDKQRVVKLPQTAGHMHGSGTAHAVGGALNQGVKSQRCVEPIFEWRTSNFFLYAQPYRLQNI